MKERPILFSLEMVRAILDGRKTMTRRVCKYHQFDYRIPPATSTECPYGQPGDRLWVREAWAEWTGPMGILGVIHKAGRDEQEQVNIKWRPSIFMPRWASRITLEITAVRVERVQDISADDVQEEGIDVVSKLPVFLSPKKSMEALLALSKIIAQGLYKDLWDSLNAKRGYGWENNPFVWVIEFRRP